MEMDINTMDLNEMLFEKLRAAFGDIVEVVSDQKGSGLAAASRFYRPGPKTLAEFENMTVQTKFDMEMRNAMERSVMDLCNHFILLVIPADTLPLPIYASDVDVHKGKYIQVTTDLLPLSRNPEYLEKYEKPLKVLKAKYAGLPGMRDKIPEEFYQRFPALKQYMALTSSNRISGNVPVAYAPQVVELMVAYVSIYCFFARESQSAAILKREDIRRDGVETKNTYRKVMAQMNFSDETPKKE
jgi:hypothetical protein